MDAKQILEKALALADEGEWEAMADLLRESLADHGQEPAIHCWLGVAERELGLEGLAYERFKRALSLGTDDPYVLATAGNGGRQPCLPPRSPWLACCTERTWPGRAW